MDVPHDADEASGGGPRARGLADLPAELLGLIWGYVWAEGGGAPCAFRLVCRRTAAATAGPDALRRALRVDLRAGGFYDLARRLYSRWLDGAAAAARAAHRDMVVAALEVLCDHAAARLPEARTGAQADEICGGLLFVAAAVGEPGAYGRISEWLSPGAAADIEAGMLTAAALVDNAAVAEFLLAETDVEIVGDREEGTGAEGDYRGDVETFVPSMRARLQREFGSFRSLVDLDDGHLCYAAVGGATRVMRVLLAHGADPRAANSRALRDAAYVGQLEAVQLLLDSGADIADGVGCAYEALASAVLGGHPDVARLLLARGSDVHAGEDEPLQLAVRSGNPEMVRLLLDAGAAPYARVGMIFHDALRGRRSDATGRSRRHRKQPPAVAAGLEADTAIVRLFLDALRADAAAPAEYAHRLGRALAAVAAERARLPMLSLLLAEGADATADGGAALKAAAVAGNVGAVPLLLARLPAASRTALTTAAAADAAAAGAGGAVDALLASIATGDRAARLAARNAALLAAVRAGQPAVVQQLLCADGGGGANGGAAGKLWPPPPADAVVTGAIDAAATAVCALADDGGGAGLSAQPRAASIASALKALLGRVLPAPPLPSARLAAACDAALVRAAGAREADVAVVLVPYGRPRALGRALCVAVERGRVAAVAALLANARTPVLRCADGRGQVGTALLSLTVDVGPLPPEPDVVAVLQHIRPAAHAALARAGAAASDAAGGLGGLARWAHAYLDDRAARRTWQMEVALLVVRLARVNYARALQVALEELGGDACAHAEAPLLYAAAGGHVQALRTLLAHGAGASRRHHRWARPAALAYACAGGHSDVVKWMLKKTAVFLPVVHAHDDLALRLAAAHGHASVVRLLLEAGADANARGAEALRVSSAAGYADVVALLLDHAADAHAHQDQALEWAAAGGHAEVVAALLKHRASVHARDNAALRAATRCVGRGVGAPPGTPSPRQTLPWVWAGRFFVDLPPPAPRPAPRVGSTVEALLDAGADPTARRHAPLVLAACNGHAAAVRPLLAHAGVDVHAQHDAALRGAAACGAFDVCQLLLDEMDARRSPPSPAALADALALATHGGHADVVRLLCQRPS